MKSTLLSNAFLDGGIQKTNFFNGRLLSAEDLGREQEADREGKRRLGLALGEGIAYGLEVTARQRPGALNDGLVVRSGTAVNRLGECLTLNEDLEVSLTQAPRTVQTGGSGAFSNCTREKVSVQITGQGVYLLVLAPARGMSGKASVSGLGDLKTECTARMIVDGLSFEAILLPVQDYREPGLRNYVAGLCLGVLAPELTLFGADPFGRQPTQYGMLDSLRPSPLSDHHVPLAIFRFTATGGISFVDCWAVRRNLCMPSQVARQYPAGPAVLNEAVLTSSRRMAEYEAMFHQFADHIEDIRQSREKMEDDEAYRRFRWLPPLGLLPLNDPNGRSRGIDPEKFFTGIPVSRELAMLDAEDYRTLTLEANAAAPLNLSTLRDKRKDMAERKIQLYRIWENQNSYKVGTVQQLALVFASPALSYRGKARFGKEGEKIKDDSAHWGSSRFGRQIV